MTSPSRQRGAANTLAGRDPKTAATILGVPTGLDESDTVEFKEQWVESAMADLAAFANTHGGTLYLGVNKRGLAIGCDVSDERQRDIVNKISAHLGVLPRVTVLHFGDVETLRVEVARAAYPVLLRGAYWRRGGTVSMKAPAEEWTRIALERSGMTWDAAPAEASIEADIDPVRVREFIERALARDKPRLPDGVRLDTPVDLVLHNLGLKVGNRPTNAALLLFGRNPQQRARHAVISAAFMRSAYELDAYPNCTGTIFDQIDAAMRIVDQAYPTTMQLPEPTAGGSAAGAQRTETLRLPPIAVKEAITNALVHRDYTRVGSDVQLRLYDDRVVILNPGGLPATVTLESLHQDPHRSERRNPLLAEILFVGFWVERFGTGTTRMIRACRDAGLPEPEFANEPEGFTLTLYLGGVSPSRLAALNLSTRQLETLLVLRMRREFSAGDYVETSGVSAPTAWRDLRDLVERGVLLVEGRGRWVRYRWP